MLQSQEQPQRHVTILFWSHLNQRNQQPWIENPGWLNCNNGHYRCLLTSDRQTLGQSDAVVLNARSLDLFRSVKELSGMPRRTCQRWVLYKKDPPSAPPFLHSVLGLFNWTMTFLQASDVRDFYQPVLLGKHDGGFKPDKNYMHGKDQLVATVINKCVPERMSWIHSLNKYVNVSVFGRYGTEMCGDRSDNQCPDVLKQYKFYLAFEDSFCKDYITEGVFKNALLNEVVPVVLSGADIHDAQVLPPGSFINALDFHSAKELAVYLKSVAGDIQKYNSFFKWHSHYSITPEESHGMMEAGERWREGHFTDTNDGICGLCKKLHTDFSTKTYSGQSSWYSFERLCRSYPVRIPYHFKRVCHFDTSNETMLLLYGI